LAKEKTGKGQLLPRGSKGKIIGINRSQVKKKKGGPESAVGCRGSMKFSSKETEKKTAGGIGGRG